MRSATRTVRKSFSLPVKLAAQVRTLANARGLSFNRMLRELIEKSIEAEGPIHQKEFFELAKRFRNVKKHRETKLLGDKLGRRVFGD